MNVKTKDWDWVTIKVKENLVLEIDKVIAKGVRFGEPKYRSRSDFVKFACLELLQKENRRKNSEDVAEKRERGEELLVARK